MISPTYSRPRVESCDGKYVLRGVNHFAGKNNLSVIIGFQANAKRYR